LNIYLELINAEVPSWAYMAGGLLTAFLIAYISIPTIVKISTFKKLYDLPNHRTSHSDAIPILGGFSIFAGFTLTAVIFSLKEGSNDLRYILGAVVILFYIGLKDDIFIIDPRKKFIGQVIASIIVVILGDIRIIDFHSVFGIEKLSYIPSILFTIFLFLTLINGYNLIDGVDGLASGTGILTCLFAGTWFTLTQNYTPAILSFSLAGSLMAYFGFNVFGKRNKIFMGDTGSMISGLIVAVIIVKFLESEKNVPVKFLLFSSPAIAFGLLIVPLFDTLRIIILRLLKGDSPFKADKNHVHHCFLRLGFSHLKTTLLILSFNLFIVVFAILFQKLGNLILIIILLFFATLFSLLPVYFLKRHESNISR
jgi:UDP-GlcNAc:undecaprenyl-phosphate GlcNAc-1-phosphate transferase